MSQQPSTQDGALNLHPVSAPGDLPERSSDRIRRRARDIHQAGGLQQALDSGKLPSTIELTLSEALVIGLLNQGISKYLAIFGHGSTDLGEVLRIYEEEGVTRTFNFRNEVEMAHAATALRWQYHETAAVITSIGPGALQAMAGSLAAASNGVGVYHIYGDETTFGEGYNMQQVPKQEQDIYGRIGSLMGQSYVLHTPEALRDALRRGSLCVNHPYKPGPFYLNMPINMQPARALFNLEALPKKPELPMMAPADNRCIADAAQMISQATRITIKAGGGTRGHEAAIRRLAKAASAAVVASPGSTGILPDADPQYMHVGGSKGSLCGNYAMSEAELVIVIGSRAVCQADCSGIGYRSARNVININGDVGDVSHYNRTLALVGQISIVADRLSDAIEMTNARDASGKQIWLNNCARKKAEWHEYKQARFNAAPITDAVWQQPVLSQPAAIKIVTDFARKIDAAKLFDAGDVQANGFQIVEDDQTGDTFTESGASYMGFAVSGLLASGIAETPRYTIAFTGDGSFMMNPQVLIDAVEHGIRGMVVIFDNRRMAAISSLQHAQYGEEFKTNDGVPVDYAAMAASITGVKALHGGFDAASLKQALAEGHAHQGLSVLHVPIYSGHNPLAGMGSWGSWNVGNWCDDVQERWITQKL